MNLLALLDELRAMARTGLNHTDDPYDEARYQRILELVTEHYGEALDRPPAAVRESLADELGQVTPKVGADVAVFDDGGRVLLMKRPESATWCLPGGALKVNESPEAGAVREAREETGLEVAPETLVDAYRHEPTTEYPHSTVLLLYFCRVTGGSLELSHEGDALRYRAIEDVHEWFGDHERMALDARTLWQSRRS